MKILMTNKLPKPLDYNKKNCCPENLITLCDNCHSKTNHNRNYWKEYFKKLTK